MSKLIELENIKYETLTLSLYLFQEQSEILLKMEERDLVKTLDVPEMLKKLEVFFREFNNNV